MKKPSKASSATADAPLSTGELETYRRKRQAGGTPEPFGSAAPTATASAPSPVGLFVLQKHAARNLHYDLRIQVGGVLKSWAVPKGPSLDPAEKRFAVLTEDHPLEYADFEGIIPAGNYGAGAMIVWDRGRCVAHIDHAEGFADGKLLFELHGFKLRGLWTLVRTQRAKEWLLIKKPDAYGTGEDADEMGAESVFSGLTVEELRDGQNRLGDVRRRLEDLQAPRRSFDPAEQRVTLCERRTAPFDHQDWVFEIKYDGYRLLGARRQARGPRRDRRDARFFFRSGNEASVAFPDLARALVALPGGSLVLDGEVVVLDDLGHPSFSLLQQRARLTRPLDAEHAAVALPATYFVFDLLAFEDFDLRPLPLVQRKEVLRLVLPSRGPLRFVEHIPERGQDVFRGVEQLGLEGMVAKKARAPYEAGRGGEWQKVRVERRGDFAVLGFRLTEGTQSGFRGLHLAARQDDQWVYVGRVGSGFDQPQRHAIRELLDPHRIDLPVEMTGERDDDPKHDVWVEPTLVVEVRFTEITHLGHLRHPVFERLRDDKPPLDCVRDDLLPQEDVPRDAVSQSLLPTGGVPQVEASNATPQASQAALEPQRIVHFTNQDKLFWPEEGYTKGDLVAYYRAVAPWLLPYLADRPVVLDRYPDGIHGKSFFQKNAPDFAPEWIRTESVWSGDAEDETLYFVCDNVETLLYLINLGSIPLHIQSGRLSDLQRPDWCILDLDAKEAPFPHVIQVAQTIHGLCEDIGWPCFAKTSGATGMHVLLPLAGQCTHDQSRQLGELVARVVADRLPEIASIARLPTSREGKVYVDFLQNGHGKLLVAPYSARPRPAATVSMPLQWKEVTEGLDPGQFTLRSAPERLAVWQEDPLAAVLTVRPPLVEILARLSEQV